jgi:hypothetical protein
MQLMHAGKQHKHVQANPQLQRSTRRFTRTSTQAYVRWYVSNPFRMQRFQPASPLVPSTSRHCAPARVHMQSHAAAAAAACGAGGVLNGDECACAAASCAGGATAADPHLRYLPC